jgi:putative Holliday junction resolvase
MRILAVDPGEKRIGLAVSDHTGTIANPLQVLKHVARAVDAAAIAAIAAECEAGAIVVGQALDAENEPTPEGRRAGRLAEAIRLQTDLPVHLWDESDSTQIARAARIALGARRRQRGGHQDALAAAVILQSYLDAHARGAA